MNKKNATNKTNILELQDINLAFGDMPLIDSFR